MNYFFKYLGLIIGLFCTVIYGGTSILDSTYQNLYREPENYLLKIEHRQMAYHNNSNADFFIENNLNLAIRLPEMILLLDDTLFYTFYKHQEKLVIDYYNNSEFNLISILNGDWNNFIIDEVDKIGQNKIIYISMKDYDISGRIEIDKDYFPIQININFSEDEYFKLNLQQNIYNLTELSEIIPDTTGWEVIDFRE